MDSTHFDRLAKGLATAVTRRTAVKVLAAGLASETLMLFGANRAKAKTTKVGICHRTDDGSFQYLEVSEAAVASHRSHGDVISPDFTSIATCGDCNTACPSPPDVCQIATCEGGVCGSAALDRTGLACSPEGNDCCEGQVCSVGLSGEPVCRSNHAPIAHDSTIRVERTGSCIPVVLSACEPDFDQAAFIIPEETLPTEGHLSKFVGSAEPVLAKARTQSGDVSAPERGRLESGPYALADIHTCSEGLYLEDHWCYFTFSSVGVVVDSFKYIAVDEFGAQSAPATVLIATFETLS